MKAYLDTDTGEVWQLEADGSQDSWIRETFSPLTDEQLLETRERQANSEKPDIELSAHIAKIKRDDLLVRAAIRIAPMQDKIDLGGQSEEASSAVMAWKKYRVELSELEDQPGFPEAIKWPVEPA